MKSPSPRKDSVKIRLTQTTAEESSRKFTHILSLYDKNLESKFSASGETKLLEPKLSLKSRQEKPPSMSKKTSFGYNKNSYLTKVKEILTSRKGISKLSVLEDNRSPRNRKPPDIFSSMKEEDILKIYDMKSVEQSNHNMSGECSKMRTISRASASRTYGMSSPKAPSQPRLTNNEEYFFQRDAHDADDYDPFTKSSECQSVQEPDFSNPNLAAVVDLVKKSVESRDAAIDLLRQERDMLQAELEACWRENDYLRARLAKQH